MDTIVVFGIPNCDITKKALAWFRENNIPLQFHDYKIAGITKEKLLEWCKMKSWEVLLNKRSTTWRGIAAAEQEKITNQLAAITLMLEQNSIIKRPVVEFGTELLVGFDESVYKKFFK